MNFQLQPQPQDHKRIQITKLEIQQKHKDLTPEPTQKPLKCQDRDFKDHPHTEPTNPNRKRSLQPQKNHLTQLNQQQNFQQITKQIN